MGYPKIETLECRLHLSVSLLKDINATTDPAQNAYGNFQLTESGGIEYFRADDGIHGPELWRSDGTSAGTFLTADIDPLPYSDANGNESDVGPLHLTDVNGTLFFTEQNPTYGIELYKSNGTAGGTVLVRDINPGTGSSFPSDLTNVNGTLFFFALDANSEDLWKSDGTANGTVMIKSFSADIPHGPTGKSFSYGGKLYFEVEDSNQQFQTWSSDGTVAGTVPFTAADGTSIDAGSSTVMNGIAYFSGSGSDGNGLWRTNGTVAGTTFITTASIRSIISINSTLYFGGSSVSLFKSDGTAAGTLLVKQLNSTGQGGQGVNNLVNDNGTLLLEVDNGSESGTGADLWRSDGTAAGTYTLAPVAFPVNEHPGEVVVENGLGYFISTDSQHGSELWETDGTVANTRMVDDVYPGSVGGLRNEAEEGGVTTNSLCASTDGSVYFAADDGKTGLELWKTDGTALGTSQVKDINQSTVSSLPYGYKPFNNGFAFVANDGLQGDGIWITDGTTNGTILLGNTDPVSQIGTSPPSPTNLTVAGGSLYFSAYDPVHGIELWRSDGTPAGTARVADLDSGSGSSNPTGLIAFGNALLFAAFDGTQFQLYQTTAASSPTPLIALGTSISGIFAPQLTVVGSSVFFQLHPSAGLNQLWKTDGTVAGTGKVQDTGTIQQLVGIGTTLFFTASDSSHGTELWKSDGTAAGTQLVTDIWPGTTGSNPSELVNANGVLFFAASDPTHGQELWKSDGTSAGTTLVADIDPGSAGSSIFELTPFGTKVIFVAKDGTGTFGVWSSNGTTAGTIPLSVDSGTISNFAVGGATAFFEIADSTGYEFWRTDGTAANTLMTAEIYPAPGGNQTPAQSGAGSIAATNGAAIFTVNDAEHGYEPWIYHQSSPEVVNPMPIPNSIYIEQDSNAAYLDIWQNTESPGASNPSEKILLADNSSIVVNGGSLADSLTVDLSKGNPFGALPFVYNCFAPGSVLKLTGSASSQALDLKLNSLHISASASLQVLPSTNSTQQNVLAVDALMIDDGARLDLMRTDMIVAGGPSVSSTVIQQLESGRLSGVGIVSSTAASDTTFLTTLAERQSDGTTFDGITPNLSDVLVKYTYYGDANLDGLVNGADYQQIDNGFGTGATDWSHGDFNYDGIVNGSDFALIDNTFNQLTARGLASTPLAQPVAAFVVSTKPPRTSLQNAAAISFSTAPIVPTSAPNAASELLDETSGHHKGHEFNLVS